MVCLACLVPLFLVPIVNFLPILFDFLMAKFYNLMGWEYRKPVRAPPACPIKPSAKNPSVGGDSKSIDSENKQKQMQADEVKQD